MSVCMHVQTFLYVFHHVKHCVSCAMTDYMQLTDLCQSHKLQLELVFDTALKSTDIASCSHQHSLVSAHCFHCLNQCVRLCKLNSDLFLLIFKSHHSPGEMTTKSP